EWTRAAAELERLVRAMQPAPAAFTTLGGRLLKGPPAAPGTGTGPAAVPGTGRGAAAGGIEVAAGAGAPRPPGVPLAREKRLAGGALVAGQRMAAGTRLG